VNHMQCSSSATFCHSDRKRDVSCCVRGAILWALRERGAEASQPRSSAPQSPCLCFWPFRAGAGSLRNVRLVAGAIGLAVVLVAVTMGTARSTQHGLSVGAYEVARLWLKMNHQHSPVEAWKRQQRGQCIFGAIVVVVLTAAVIGGWLHVYGVL
jgi:hypothetical protein